MYTYPYWLTKKTRQIHVYYISASSNSSSVALVPPLSGVYRLLGYVGAGLTS
jgi:hypothetical protein